MKEKPKEEDLERVSGIARYHERMWIERDEEGKIKQVYDLDLNPIDKKMLYLSFESITRTTVSSIRASSSSSRISGNMPESGPTAIRDGTTAIRRTGDCSSLAPPRGA